jgi:hypothetical protein
VPENSAIYECAFLCTAHSDQKSHLLADRYKRGPWRERCRFADDNGHSVVGVSRSDGIPDFATYMPQLLNGLALGWDGGFEPVWLGGGDEDVDAEGGGVEAIDCCALRGAKDRCESARGAVYCPRARWIPPVNGRESAINAKKNCRREARNVNGARGGVAGGMKHHTDYGLVDKGERAAWMDALFPDL